MRNELTRKLQRFVFNRRGVSQVISSVIMASAVMALGFAVLLYAQKNAVDSNMEYADNTNRNILTIQEKLAFEYIHNNSSLNELTIFLINCGKSDEVALARAYLAKDLWSQLFEDLELKMLNGTITQDLDVLEEGFFQLSIDLEEGTSYSIQVVTTRGRKFVTTFVA